LEGRILGNLGRTYYRQGQLTEAIACYEQSLVLFRETGNRHSEGLALWHLGSALAAMRDEQAARKRWHDALTIFVELGAPEADEVRVLLRSIEPGGETARERERSPGAKALFSPP
jgi:tetratricopeptide (TPR) repeat protein